MDNPEPLSPSPEIRYQAMENALRKILDCLDCAPLGLRDRVIRDEARAALASSEKPPTQAPEIRYQLRNWHHVTCAGFGGQACTCLAQREALIAELALKEKL